MPYYESPSLFIDFSRLPPPQVIEEIDYEELLKRYKAQVLERKPDLAQALRLEQSPANIILEVEAYGETIVRSRVNSAARAVMLAFATGADLEHLGTFYGVQRVRIAANPSAVPPVEAYTESDDRLRRRIQLAPESFTSAGSEAAYVFHALSAEPTLRDASAVKTDNLGNVKITVMNQGTDPTPTDAQLLGVLKRLNGGAVRPLTDVVSVARPTIHETRIEAAVTLYPGLDEAAVMADINKALVKVRDRVSVLGRDLTRSAIFAAISQEGVMDVELTKPAADVVAQPDECVIIKSATVSILPLRQE